MRRGQGQRDSCKNACLKIFVSTKKVRVGVNEVRVRTKPGLQGGVKIMVIRSGLLVRERRGSVLTNQCLGKETNDERGAEESFLMDNNKFIVERHVCTCESTMIIMMWQSHMPGPVRHGRKLIRATPSPISIHIDI